MNFKDYAFTIFPKILGYNLGRLTSFNLCNPITLTFPVTAACQSLWKIRQIGQQYRDDPHRVKNNLSLIGIETIVKIISHFCFLNMSIGERLLRTGLPTFIHIPTNAISTTKVKKGVQDFFIYHG